MTDYAFKGQTIRLNQADYDQWKKVFYAIPDFDAELFTLDAFYTEEGEKKWFIRCSRALLKAHYRALEARRSKDSNRPAWDLPWEDWQEHDKAFLAEIVATRGEDYAVRYPRQYRREHIKRLRVEGYLQPREARA